LEGLRGTVHVVLIVNKNAAAKPLDRQRSSVRLSRAALLFVKEAATEPVKIALAAMAIPLSRREMDFGAPNFGMAVVDKEGILPPTEDYTPFATKVQASLQNLKVDLRGLRGGPIEWTKDNHFRLK
jgi:hypothetical protein